MSYLKSSRELELEGISNIEIPLLENLASNQINSKRKHNHRSLKTSLEGLLVLTAFQSVFRKYVSRQYLSSCVVLQIYLHIPYNMSLFRKRSPVTKCVDKIFNSAKSHRINYTWCKINVFLSVSLFLFLYFTKRKKIIQRNNTMEQYLLEKEYYVVDS